MVSKEKRELPYRSVEDYPPAANACGITARLLDGLGFRFYWATEGLDARDFGYSAGGGSMSIGELTQHIWGLMNWIHKNIHQEELERPRAVLDQRDDVLRIIAKLRADILHMGDEGLSEIEIEGFPFWHLINGPISDAISHVGQINILRRVHGKAARLVNVFAARAPREG